MMTNLVIRKQNLYPTLFGFLRYTIFVAFYVISLQLIFVPINHRTMNPLLLGSLLLGIAALSWWKIHWSLYVLLLAIPLVNGLQLLDFIPPLSLLSSIFASIYLVWLPRRLFSAKEKILPRTEVGHLVDILSGIVTLSLVISYLPYPLDAMLHQFWRNPFEAYDGLSFSTHGANVLLQGLFFFRIMELEINDRSKWQKLVSIFYLQVPIIAFFLIVQIIYRIPPLPLGNGFYAPFDDVHSCGSYISLLFFLFLSAGYGESLRHKFYFVIFSGFLFLFIILSYSRATWLAVIIIGAAFLTHKVPIRKKMFPISCIVLIFLSVNLFPDFLIKSRHPYIQRFGRLVVLSEVVTDSGAKIRVDLWKRAINIISDFPITGSGMGTFWEISPLYQDWDISELRDFRENAHNYFLQLASDLGLPALLIFLSIFFFTYKIGFWVSSQDPKVTPFVQGLLLGLSAYLITCLTGHPLLLLNQQFLFWFIIASIVIPQGLMNQRALSIKVFPKSRTLFFLLAAMLVGAYVYDLWGITRKQQYEYGFYDYELWGNKKVRWTGKKTTLRTSTTGRLITFDIYTSPYNIDSKGLNFKIFVNKELWDEINLTKAETRNLKYYISHKKNEPMEIKTEVNRTFIPIRLGLSRDPRNLGVALGEIKFYDEILEEGIGFWATDTFRGIQIPGWPKNIPVEVRLTGLRASMNIEHRFKDGITLFLKVDHPDAGKNPVKVKILGNSRIIEEVTCCDHQWKRIHLDAERLMDSNVLTFHANRTWNPKLLGLAEDNRDLGVAVAIIKPVSSKP